MDAQECSTKAGKENKEKEAMRDEAGPSTAPPKKHGVFDYDVFLSFRGTDTRNNFTSTLQKELKGRGITAFIDNENLDKGEKITELLDYIEKSQIFIPIFSENYAHSEWCLKEIAKMVEINKVYEQKRPIIPVFYHVKPSDVREQEGSFKDAFSNHQDREKEELDEWRNALTSAGERSGHTVTAHVNEAELITEIGNQVSDMLKKVPFDIAHIGIDPCIDDVKNKLKTEANGVCIVGICGPGGIGKTTIAMAIYNKLSPEFEGTSFIKDVRENAKKLNGLTSLQTKLLRDILKEEISISTVEEGKSLIKKRLGRKRVLIILDDVDHVDQLQAFTAEQKSQEVEWFGVGSKILVTTRDMEVLVMHGVKEEKIYIHEGLDYTHSLQLFCRHAFSGGRSPPEFVQVTGGLPLALKVFGPLFYGKNKDQWEKWLKKLKKDQHKDIHERLRISYQGLEPNEKCIFLDIACFFIGKDKEYPTYIWEEKDYSLELALNVLKNRSLVSIDTANRFRMHDVIRDMGREIVRQEGMSAHGATSDPKLRSRLWDRDDIWQVLHNKEGKTNNSIQAIVLEYHRDDNREQNLNTKAFAEMPNLRLLHISSSNPKFKDTLSHLPRKLKWLKWEGPSMTFEGCHFEELVVLEVRNFFIRQLLWSKQGLASLVFNNLKVLDLFGCRELIKTPSFAPLPCLVKLILDGCWSLVKVDETIGHLNKLTLLSMRSCTSLLELPNSLCRLSSLKSLILEDCSKLLALPERIGDMESLEELILNDCSSLVKVGETIGLLNKLTLLSMRSCTSLLELPNSLCRLSSLKRLILEDCWSLLALPERIGDMESLEELILDDCLSLVKVDETIGRLNKLTLLSMRRCVSLLELPNSLCRLSSLKSLRLERCSSLLALPERIGDMESLEELILDN